MTSGGRSVSEDRPVLEVDGIFVRYGANVVVHEVSLSVGRGELLGLIGANGAGKTTTIDAISGFAEHGGSVRLDGVDLSSAPPHRRARAGVGRTWQSVELFADLTVAQNCLAAARTPGWGSMLSDLLHRPDPPEVLRRVDDALAAVGLTGDADRLPQELPHGRQKLAGVARALAGSPSVVLLDEPAAGLDQGESDAFGRTLRRVVDESGLAALLVDHDTRLVFDVCDRVAVLDAGELVAVGTPSEVRSDLRVIEAYLGVGP